MGNVCPLFQQGGSQQAAPTERSGLLTNQHASARPQQHHQPPPGASAVSQHPYTVASVTNSRLKTSDSCDLTFARVGLENLDKRLKDLAALFNSLLERYSNLKTGLIQLNQIGREICSKQEQLATDGAPKAVGNDVLGDAFGCFAQQIAQTADTDAPISIRLKEHAKNWTEIAFDSKCLQFDENSFLNLYNLLCRYAWELRSKTPPLRHTVAMTTQEEETFRRDLLVASLGSEANAFGANFARLRRVDEQLGEFEKLGTDAGERLATAGRKLMA